MSILPLLLGLLPSFAWLVFYLKEDPHPEPKKLIFETFLAGAIATFIVLGVQVVVADMGKSNGIAPYSFLSFILLATVEEVFKFGAARLVIGEHKKDFDEPVDAMIYLIVAALGFATVENIAAAVKASEFAFETVTLRFLGATLLHTLSSGLLGYYWAMSLLEKNWKKLLTGFTLAIALHAVFNYLILRYEPIVIPTIFLTISATFILYDFEKLKHIKI